MNALLRRLLGLGDAVPPRRTFHFDDGRTLDTPLDADGQPAAERAEAFLLEGESAELLGVRVTFRRVLDDRRCPTGAACFVPGQAHAEADVEASGTRRTVAFGIWASPDATLVETPDGLRAATVVDLAPYPTLDTFRATEAYQNEVKRGLYVGPARLGVQVFAVDPAAVSAAPPAARTSSDAPPRGPSILDTLGEPPATGAARGSSPAAG